MLANFFSVLRLLLLPFVLYSLKQDGDAASPTTVVLLLLAAATDILDGYVARRFAQVSRLGQILDPLADKIFLGGLAASLLFWRDFPLWLLVMLVVRDVGIVLAGLFLLRTRNLVIPANRIGKCTTVCVVCTAVSFLLGAPGAVKLPLVYAAAALLVISSLSYVRLLGQTLIHSPSPSQR